MVSQARELGRGEKTVSSRNRALPSFAATAVWSLAGVLLLAAGAPPLHACDGGAAVPNPGDNPGLAEDCKALLAFRDKLSGGASAELE